MHMIIIPTVLFGILLVSGFSGGVNEGLPSRKQRISLWPIDLIYILPRVVAPFFIVYPMIFFKSFWVFLIGVLLYLLSYGIKALFWKVAYGLDVFKS